MSDTLLEKSIPILSSYTTVTHLLRNWFCLAFSKHPFNYKKPMKVQTTELYQNQNQIDEKPIYKKKQRILSMLA